MAPAPRGPEPRADESFDLSGRVAVITGGSAGIGAATARRLAARGMQLVLGARRVERQQALADELSARHGTRALSLPLDVADGASVARFAEAAEAFAGEPGVHLLVNNAGLAKGVARIPTASESDERDWETMFAVNVLGLLRVTRRFVPGMVKRDAGHVISKALRLELLGSQVRVCCINPGLAETEFSVVRLGSQEKADAVYAGMTPLTADDIAASIEWVASLPAVMNIEELNLQPVDQASAQKVHRRPR